MDKLIEQFISENYGQLIKNTITNAIKNDLAKVKALGDNSQAGDKSQGREEMDIKSLESDARIKELEMKLMEQENLIAEKEMQIKALKQTINGAEFQEEKEKTLKELIQAGEL